VIEGCNKAARSLQFTTLNSRHYLLFQTLDIIAKQASLLLQYTMSKNHWISSIHKLEYLNNNVKHNHMQPSDTIEIIQTVITAAKVNDVVVLPTSSVSEGETDELLIKRNSHFVGNGTDTTGFI